MTEPRVDLISLRRTIEDRWPQEDCACDTCNMAFDALALIDELAEARAQIAALTDTLREIRAQQREDYARAERAEQAQAWQPIETAPKDGTEPAGDRVSRRGREKP